MGGMPPRRCLLEKRCLPNTPLHHVYKWVSHIAMELVDHLDSSFVPLLSLYNKDLLVQQGQWHNPPDPNECGDNLADFQDFSGTLP